MKIFQLLFVLTTSSTLCLSQECGKKEEIYTGTKLPSSCKEILAKYPATPSGYYLIQPLGYSSSKVYCDMENEHCGTKGWTRVAHVNMSDSTQACPGNLNLIPKPVRSCVVKVSAGCSSASFSSYGISYSQVCGKLRGYQVGGPGAFGPYVHDQANPSLVVDGILISHGQTQAHVWAYATGYQKRVPPTNENTACPCAGPRFNGIIPPFIGNYYYCDSGVLKDPELRKFYTTPLWTGEGCTPNFCCSQSGMPWFCKTLPVPTTDYIEIRNCHNANDEDTALDQIELYIR